MKKREVYEVEIREGDRYYSFYSVRTGRWISGCKKAYLLDVMNELTQRFYDLYGEETYFKIGGYENDEETRRRLQNGAAGARYDR